MLTPADAAGDELPGVPEADVIVLDPPLMFMVSADVFTVHAGRVFAARSYDVVDRCLCGTVALEQWSDVSSYELEELEPADELAAAFARSMAGSPASLRRAGGTGGAGSQLGSL